MTSNTKVKGDILKEGRLWRDAAGVLHAEGFEVRFAEGQWDLADPEIGLAGMFFKQLAEERGL